MVEVLHPSLIGYSLSSRTVSIIIAFISLFCLRLSRRVKYS